MVRLGFTKQLLNDFEYRTSPSENDTKYTYFRYYINMKFNFNNVH